MKVKVYGDWYVLENNQMIPVNSEEDADLLIKKLKENKRNVI